ncbi:DUF3085 domain-containing protein [Bradyrhizobium japonicum]|uniref:DUF3085 domain-containing protein n=1 Tax=Bradyrhizobium japonicum TaxID=375 RepID=UPI0020A087F5|nr:DUF3085 domain-containing protein [Bradyrhizobium japonicum]MCP1761961.1 hypothetical protein [Bradyrhizobium japonicum]MCP1793541.1 hypothetical protein [Bradyrhizobium japonicum]MCP1805974.1 hypothetical protein [Bradyrhizobium japonicum]MCP1812377.1 hypothetical protein [Bradyrhizobium japonicum]MCP1873580.1 hypothetical protein [Bradyrhizobium japonicum]
MIFNAADVRRVVEHSIAAPKQGETVMDYAPKTGKPMTKPVPAPSVLLVHDQGVYLMSNGEPRDVISQTSFVAYARGCHPIADSDWWETSRALVGGDDFSETLPWAAEFKALLDRGAKTIALEFRDDAIEIVEG